MTIPLVLVCAAPRTGTNHLCRILSGFEGLKAHTEVFARDVAFSVETPDLEALSDITGCIIPTGRNAPTSPTVTQLIYDEPGATVMALWKTREPHHRAMSIKLFAYHLPRGWTKEFFRMGAVPLVVKRRKIDSYISKLKAQKIQAWVGADTTLLKVRADIRDYKYWLHRHRQWYDHVEECGHSPIRLTYEDHIAKPAPDLAEHLANTLGKRVDLGEWRPVRGLNKQDRNERPEDKVANWVEFSADLAAEGLLDDAFGYF